jgi:hypothetical protein
MSLKLLATGNFHLYAYFLIPPSITIIYFQLLILQNQHCNFLYQLLKFLYIVDFLAMSSEMYSVFTH